MVLEALAVPWFQIVHQTLLTSPSASLPFVRYGEFLKNHAASIGGNGTDGCGQFMPPREQGTLEALNYFAAYFHRKETKGLKGAFLSYGMSSPQPSAPQPSVTLPSIEAAWPLPSQFDELDDDTSSGGGNDGLGGIRSGGTGERTCCETKP
ncbi:ZF-HD homeobox protein, Cys/His-rich dimerization domain [Dillenia turbinata]|uniref:ZF-HD homeobox protein, Cys/His-rich dimerization domain n=1 Tax=Dillenia turbinata TaxID=194707 RepID=A0AAN8WCK6_9MAGN